MVCNETASIKVGFHKTQEYSEDAWNGDCMSDAL